jgi:hypothetical protein
MRLLTAIVAVFALLWKTIMDTSEQADHRHPTVASQVAAAHFLHVEIDNYVFRDSAPVTAAVAMAGSAAPTSAAIWQVRRNFEQQHEPGVLALTALGRETAQS